MEENQKQEMAVQERRRENKGDILLQIKENMELENEYLRKQLSTSRIMMSVLTACFLLLLFSVMTLVPKVSETLEQAGNTIMEADKAIDQISQTMTQAEDVFTSVKSMVEESEESLTLTIDAVSKIDFQGLNQSIEDLGSVVSPLAGFFERFR